MAQTFLHFGILRLQFADFIFLFAHNFVQALNGRERDAIGINGRDAFALLRVLARKRESDIWIRSVAVPAAG